jgi:putative FmdB family regulatory protein
MPLYEYECSDCGHHFEVIRKFSDPPEEKCPKCGGLVRKLQSAPAFQFKGTGWYVTDYAKSGQPDSKDGPKPEGKADTDGKKDAATGTSGRTESAASGGSSSPASSGTPAASGTAASKSGE